MLKCLHTPFMQELFFVFHSSSIIIIMNLFILSLCFRECAEAMFDKHVSKMILEAAQMLCTAKQMLDPDAENQITLYKISHKNHPVSIWMRQSLENFMWAIEMAGAMHDEWKYRYDHPQDKVHKSYAVIQYLRDHPPNAEQFPEKGLTPFAQAMPEQYKSETDAVEAYRRYYQSPDKQKIATWKKREPPMWYTKYEIIKVKRRSTNNDMNM